LIADVWFARADFAKDHPRHHRGAGARHLRRDGGIEGPISQTGGGAVDGTGYSIPATDALSMLGRRPLDQRAENREFFVNANNPGKLERTWNTAYFLYGASAWCRISCRSTSHGLTIIKKLAASPLREPAQRVSGAVRADDRDQRTGREQ